MTQSLIETGGTTPTKKREEEEDEIIMKHGHPLCLPVYHPDSTPIESVWGEIKGKVAHQNTGS